MTNLHLTLRTGLWDFVEDTKIYHSVEEIEQRINQYDGRLFGYHVAEETLNEDGTITLGTIIIAG